MNRKTIPFGKGSFNRKFLSPDNNVVVVKNKKNNSNSEHVVEYAKGFEGSFLAADKIVDFANNEIDQFFNFIDETQNIDDDFTFKGKKLTDSDFDSFLSKFLLKADLELNIGQNNPSKQIILSSLRDFLRKNFIERKNKELLKTVRNKADPQIVFVKLIEKRGIFDKFSAEINFSLKIKDINVENAKAVRVFRAKINKANINNRLKILTLSKKGIENIKNEPLKIKEKNSALNFNVQNNILVNNGISTSLSKTIIDEPFTNKKNISGSEQDKTLNKNLNNGRENNESDLELLKSFVTSESVLPALDRSVLNDLKSMRNIQISNPDKIAKKVFKENVGLNFSNESVGKIKERQIFESRSVSELLSDFIIKNSVEYKELFIMPLSSLKSKRFDNEVRYKVFDETIQFGCEYNYYLTILNNQAIESQRTEIVNVVVEDSVPPLPPEQVRITDNRKYIYFSLLHDSAKVEKFEFFRKSEKNEEKKIITVFDSNGFVVSEANKVFLKNNFIQIGESLNSLAGSVFVDKDVVVGKTYNYRIYAVDVFGNKSQAKEVEYFFNERNKRFTNLIKPTVLAEKKTGTDNVLLTIESSDDRIIKYFVEKRNLTINEKEFTNPYTQSHIKFGNKRNFGGKFFEGIVSRTRENNWTGVIDRNSDKEIFIDSTTKYDFVYQYRIYGVDRFGEKTSFSFSDLIFISRKPILDPPLNVKASFDNGQVVVSWDPSTIDVEPIDRIGNREKLENNEVKTIFQVERKGLTEEVWQKFPLTENFQQEDNVSFLGEKSPPFKPEFLKQDSSYLYRVVAFQSGGFVSQYSDIVRVNTFLDVLSPVNFSVKTCNTKCEPFFVVLNWDTPNNSGTVDKWIIEKAALNNFAAFRINSLNSSLIDELEFKKFKIITKESSRSIASTYDEQAKNIKNNLFFGQHRFVDNEIKFGNTYFYRIISVGLDNSNSATTSTKAIKITDKEFEKILRTSVSQEQKVKLANSKDELDLKFLEVR